MKMARKAKTSLLTCFLLCLLFVSTSFSERLGTDQIYSNTSTSSDRRAMPYTMTEDGEIYSVVMYHDGGSGLMRLAVYNNYFDGSTNYPNQLLAETPETGVSGASGWQEIFLNTRYCASAGEILWLAWVYESTPGIRYTSGTPGRASSGEGWISGMPTSFGTSSLTDYIYSINANYSTGAQMQVCGTPPPPVDYEYPQDCGANENMKVDGTIKAEKFIIGDWVLEEEGTPDYVFKEDYALTPLPVVERYVKQYSHLPEIPSAREMKEHGLDVIKFNMQLLKKIEEITLHLIKQEKEIVSLQTTNKILQEQIRELQTKNKE